jgi:lipopolysaccharide transport protein LptA
MKTDRNLIIRGLMMTMLVLGGAWLAYPAMAAEQKQAAAAIDIVADQALEWDRQNNTYVATGKAKVTYGAWIITAEVIRARHAPNQPEALTEIDAEGDVVITRGQLRARAPKAHYVLASEKADLTGQNLSLTTPKGTITAQRAMSYDGKTYEAIASGNAVAKREGVTVAADQMTALFTSQNDLREVKTEAPVTITRAQDKITAQRGVYNAAQNLVTLTGDVEITQSSGNRLNGDKATYDTQTGISRLFAPYGDEGDGRSPSGGRVRATFKAKE